MHLLIALLRLIVAQRMQICSLPPKSYIVDCRRQYVMRWYIVHSCVEYTEMINIDQYRVI